MGVWVRRAAFLENMAVERVEVKVAVSGLRFVYFTLCNGEAGAGLEIFP